MYVNEYKKLKKSLTRLEECYKEWLECSSRPELRDSDREAIKESCIQRFVYCYDILWEHLRKHLTKIGANKVPYNSKDLFRMSAENGLIEDVENWFNYTNKRNDIAHDYDEIKANQTLMIIPDFIEDTTELYEAMMEEWNDL